MTCFIVTQFRRVWDEPGQQTEHDSATTSVAAGAAFHAATPVLVPPDDLWHGNELELPAAAADVALLWNRRRRHHSTRWQTPRQQAAAAAASSDKPDGMHVAYASSSESECD